MKILVTGAAGFIGSHLIPALSEHHVIASDRSDTDLSHPGRAKALIDGVRPDYVIHLAARYGRILCRDEPHRAVSDNAAATTELAAACAEWNVPVLYASSSEVYGDHGTDTITEESELRTPTTIYGLSKRWGEEALRLYLPPENLLIVRLNMLYGPGQRGGYGCCALATFIRDALEDKSLTVHEGTSRSWLYIFDAVEALRLLIDNGHRGVFNLGNSHESEPVEETAFRVVDHVDSGTVTIIDSPANQIRHKVYSAARIEALGWSPQVRLQEGIERTVAHARTEGIRDYAVA